MAAWKILLTDGLEANGQEILRQSAESRFGNRRGTTRERIRPGVQHFHTGVFRKAGLVYRARAGSSAHGSGLATFYRAA